MHGGVQSTGGWEWGSLYPTLDQLWRELFSGSVCLACGAGLLAVGRCASVAGVAGAGVESMIEQSCVGVGAASCCCSALRLDVLTSQLRVVSGPESRAMTGLYVASVAVSAASGRPSLTSR